MLILFNLKRGWGIASITLYRIYRACCGAVVLGSYIYAIGGFDGNTNLDKCERYNFEDNTWTSISQLSTPRGKKSYNHKYTFLSEI